MDFNLRYNVYVNDRLAYITENRHIALAKARKLMVSHTVVSIKENGKLIHLFRR